MVNRGAMVFSDPPYLPCDRDRSVQGVPNDGNDYCLDSPSSEH